MLVQLGVDFAHCVSGQQHMYYCIPLALGRCLVAAAAFSVALSVAV